VACLRKGWAVMRNDFLSVDECMIAGNAFERQTEFRKREDGTVNTHSTIFYDDVYGPYKK